jgi:hypothetical protein
MGGFNTQRQNQSSGGSSESRGQSENWSSNNAYNTSLQNAANQSLQQATSATSLYGAQAPFLQNLWGQGAGLAAGDPGIAGQARGAWGQALGAGINPGVADVIANASQEMGLNFSRNAMPAIRHGAVGTGSLGGSRQGIAEGLAAGELARSQQQLSSQLYAGALDNASRERTAALSMSGQMQALPWQGLESYARVVGQPVMESFGSSTGSSYGASGGSSYGASSGNSYGYNSQLANASNFGAGAGSGFGLNVLTKGN